MASISGSNQESVSFPKPTADGPNGGIEDNAYSGRAKTDMGTQRRRGFKDNLLRKIGGGTASGSIAYDGAGVAGVKTKSDVPSCNPRECISTIERSKVAQNKIVEPNTLEDAIGLVESGKLKSTRTLPPRSSSSETIEPSSIQTSSAQSVGNALQRKESAVENAKSEFLVAADTSLHSHNKSKKQGSKTSNDELSTCSQTGASLDEMKIAPSNTCPGILEKKSSVEIEKMYVDSLISALEGLTLQRFLHQTGNGFCSDIISSWKKYPPPNWLVSQIPSIYDQISKQIQVLESEFEASKCLSPTKMGRILVDLRLIKSGGLRSLPQPVKDIVGKKISAVITEYEDLNKHNIVQDEEVYAELTCVAVEYYENEMKFLISDKYLDEPKLESYHTDVSKEAMDHFVSAAAFGEEHWKKMYTGKLATAVHTKFEEMKILHNQNKDVLLNKLNKIKKDVIEFLTNHLNRNLETLLDPEGFKNVGKISVNEASFAFESQIKIQVMGQHENQIKLARSELQRQIDKVYNEIRQSWIEGYTKRENDRKEQERLKEEAKKMQEQAKEEARKKQDQTKGESMKAEKGKNKVNRNILAESAAKFPEDGRHTNANDTEPDDQSCSVDALPAELSCNLPSQWLAIYFGLSWTSAGIIIPGTTTFRFIASVRNKLFFENKQLLAYNWEELKQMEKANGTKCEANIMQIPTDRLNEAKIKGTSKKFRIEDYISFIFTTLKWKAELELKMDISRCVICVPQCLNNLQRTSIIDGAVIAGFKKYDLMSDTAACTLDYLVTQTRNAFSRRNLVVANTCESFIDAGYYNCVDGVITCNGISGHHFIADGLPLFHSYVDPHYRLGSFYMAKERLSRIFSFGGNYNLKAEKANTTFVVCGDVRFAIDSVRRFCESQKNVVYQNPGNIVRGAAFLASLIEKSAGNPLVKPWEQLLNNRYFEMIWEISQDVFTKDFTIDAQRHANLPNGKGLTPMELDDRVQNFFLRNKRDLHCRKMKILQKLFSLRTRINHLKKESLGELLKFEKIVSSESITTEQVVTNLESQWRKMMTVLLGAGPEAPKTYAQVADPKK